MNLTGARSPAERVTLLVAGVLPIASRPAPGRLIDVGSGNGSPGLVLALVRDDIEVTLLEPRARRWAFLREAARSAGPARSLSVLRARHDEYEGPPAATVTVRALALPLRALEPLVEPAGQVIVLGSRPDPAPGFVRITPTPAAAIHIFRRTGGDVSRDT